MTEPTAANPGPKGDRIAKLLARAGIASRREIERMIAEGRVALDGVVLDTPATILTSLRGITVDGDPVAPPEAARLFLYHKPTGLLVTERDPAGRPTIYDRLPADLPRTVPVGRLDLNTEGLLLLTSDGGLKRQLELPATGVERTYRARAYGNVTQAQLEELIEGIEIDGIRYGPIDANLERRTGANTWIEMTLTEGKNREVRRVLEHLGLQVGRLIRTRYGPFVLADLPPGEVGEVKQHDLVAFTKSLGNERRAKGADLQSPVTVGARAKAPAAASVPVPAPASRPQREPDRPLRRAAPAAWPAPPRPATGGWGSRTRPSRPTDTPEAKPARGQFRLSDDRGPRAPADRPARGDTAPRSTRPPFPRGDEGRTSDQHRQRHDGDRQPAGRPARPFDDRARPAAAGRFVDQRPARPARGDDRAGGDRAGGDRAGTGAPPRGARPQTSPFSSRPGRTATDPRATFPDRADRPGGNRGRPDRTQPDRGADRDRPDRARPPRDASPRGDTDRARPGYGRSTSAASPRSRPDGDRNERPARPFADRGAGRDAPPRPGKGPSGGRGHPPRGPNGAPKAPGRGKR